MNRCSPVDMRKCLEAVEHFKNEGIRFVPIPVTDDLDHDRVVLQMIAKLETIEYEAEEDDKGECDER